MRSDIESKYFRAFRQHEGPHTDALNWETFLKFADRYIKGPGLKPMAANDAPK